MDVTVKFVYPDLLLVETDWILELKSPKSFNTAVGSSLGEYIPKFVDFYWLYVRFSESWKKFRADTAYGRITSKKRIIIKTEKN